jgi:hypothetical protein
VIENKIYEKKCRLKKCPIYKNCVFRKNGNFSYAGINLKVIFSSSPLALS